MKQLQRQILDKLNVIREDVLHTEDLELKSRKLKAATLEVCEAYDGTIAVNYKELLDIQFSRLRHDIDKLINYLKKDIDNTFDLETVRREQEEDFDGKYGSQTSAMISQIELPEEVSPDRIKYSARYHPSPVRIVEKALSDLANYEVEYKDWTFIDIGSGLGRNLLLASRFGFGRIIGVEISDYLCRQSRKNIEIYNEVEATPCVAEVHCIDILKYEFPAGNLVLYFWEPFEGQVQEEFVRRLESHIAGSPHRVVLIFLGTVFPGIASSKYFKLAGRWLNASEQTIGLGITYFQGL